MATTTTIQSESTDITEVSRLKVALLVIATAQLMFVLDDSIANIALPSIQKELNISTLTLPWIINAYILAFGGLLLFGGRVGDLYGRRKIFRIGVIVFTVASLLGGLASNVGLLIAFRGLQGIGAALAAPNALALIATNFPVGKSRNSAMAVYGGMSALGITIGVLLGGFLTGVLSWRWVFFINVPIGLAVLAGTKSLVEGKRNTGKLDFIGAISGVAATVTLAYGITRGGEHGWSDVITMGSFAASAVLITLFILLQKYSKNPMLPLSLFNDRNRSGSYVTMLFVGAGLMGTFYLLALYLQQVLQFSPLKTGLSSLPFSVGIILGAGIGSKLVERFAPRTVAGPGLLIATAGVFWLSTLELGSSYFAHVLPSVIVIYFGLGLTAVTITLTAVYKVEEERTSIASALVNMAQQVGAALGLAVFTSVSTTAANEKLSNAMQVLQGGLVSNNKAVIESASVAVTHGYTSAFLTEGGMLIVAAMIILIVINTRHTQSSANSNRHL